MLPVLAAAIPAVTSLIGSFMQSESAKENRDIQMAQAAQNLAQQREFAQSGIQWRVEDARKAGVHPLFALGASTSSFSPVSVGSLGDTSMGSGLAAAGQHIGRAMSAAATQQERDALMGATSALQMENMQLQNEFLRSRIALTRSQIGPPMPEVHPASVAGWQHPMAKKPEDNPWIQMGGVNISPAGGWSPMKAVQDRYGDEGPVNWGAQVAVAMADAEKNFGPVESWPRQVATYVASRIWNELTTGSFIRFEPKPWHGLWR